VADVGHLSLQGLVKRFGAETAVDGLDLEIGAGKFFSLLGSSGSGKTTTLRMIAGFEQPDAGRIRLDGRDLVQVPPHKRPVNTVFQSYALFPFLTVQENVEFGLRYHDVRRTEARRRASRSLELVQMGALARRKPHQLSGGQQQRVALARALVLEPTVLLLDEPMGALDAKLRRQLQVELRSIQRLVGTTFVYVTHDQEEALTMSDRLAVLHEGRLMQVGAPSEVYSQPANAYVAGFLGSANLLEAEVLGVSAEGVRCRAGALELLVDTELPVHAGERVDLLLRPERLQLGARSAGPEAPAVNRLVARVDRLAFRGAQTQVALLVAGVSLLADVPNVHGEVPPWLDEGSEVVVEVSPSAVRLLRDSRSPESGPHHDTRDGAGDPAEQSPRKVSDGPPNVAAGTSS
jgi:spermidine/putrescine transport system ATP-binding protein